MERTQEVSCVRASQPSRQSTTVNWPHVRVSSFVTGWTQAASTVMHSTSVY